MKYPLNLVIPDFLVGGNGEYVKALVDSDVFAGAMTLVLIFVIITGLMGLVAFIRSFTGFENISSFGEMMSGMKQAMGMDNFENVEKSE